MGSIQFKQLLELGGETGTNAILYFNTHSSICAYLNAAIEKPKEFSFRALFFEPPNTGSPESVSIQNVVEYLGKPINQLSQLDDEQALLRLLDWLVEKKEGLKKALEKVGMPACTHKMRINPVGFELLYKGYIWQVARRGAEIADQAIRVLGDSKAAENMLGKFEHALEIYNSYSTEIMKELGAISSAGRKFLEFARTPDR